MKSIWFKGAKDDQEQAERRLAIVSAARAFEILTGILEAKARVKDTERNSDKNYALPAYAAMQADASGYIRAMREVTSLLNLQEE